ncbi:nuclear transport factor 2 family protein [Lacinutrix salivirga]
MKIKLLLIIILFVSCKSSLVENTSESIQQIKKEVTTSLDNWHKAAANADYDAYFNLMTQKGVFIGTDASENWQNNAFKTFSKPYFDKGKAWSFTPLERHIYVSEDKNTVWFDELLDTQMKLCRGSGVLLKENNTWKVAHYVLSIAIPNANVSEVVKIKKESDNLYTQKLKTR